MMEEHNYFQVEVQMTIDEEWTKSLTLTGYNYNESKVKEAAIRSVKERHPQATIKAAVINYQPLTKKRV